MVCGVLGIIWEWFVNACEVIWEWFGIGFGVAWGWFGVRELVLELVWSGVSSCGLRCVARLVVP